MAARTSQAPALPSNHPGERKSWIPEEILRLPYFHLEILNSDAATAYIKSQKKSAGTFLLRKSSKGENYLSLSVCVGNGHVHHLQVFAVKQHNGHWSYYIVREVVFDSFEKLQEYYSKHCIGNMENIDNVRLLQPLLKRTRTTSLPNVINYDPNLTDRRRIFGNNRQNSDVLVQRRSDTSMDSQGSENRHSGSSNEDQGVRISNSGSNPSMRPPLPLPVQIKARDGSDPYYSRTNNEDRDRARELQELLRNSERCDCGLLLVEAELGSNWAVHKSRDTLTLGRLFFQNTQGTTSWTLPETILCKLPPPKLEFLVGLYHQGNQKLPFDEEKLKQLNAAMMF